MSEPREVANFTLYENNDGEMWIEMCVNGDSDNTQVVEIPEQYKSMLPMVLAQLGVENAV